MQSIRQGDWKMLRFNFIIPEKLEFVLFNLATDPYEKNNLANEKPTMVEEMTRILNSQHNDYMYINLKTK